METSHSSPLQAITFFLGGDNKLKWFKYYSNAHQSESLAALLDDLGFQGWGRYWHLLAYLNNIFDGENTKFKLHRRTLRELLRFRSWNDLETFADRLANVRGTMVKRCGNVYEIDVPILLELLGRDFRMARQHRVSTAPKNKIKNNIKGDVKKAEALDFDAIYKIYPRKKGKAPGLTACKKLIKDPQTFSLAKSAAEELRKEFEKRPKTELTYCQYFSTWVNAQPWLDDSEIEKKPRTIKSEDWG